jgi:hypothetical protein
LVRQSLGEALGAQIAVAVLYGTSNSPRQQCDANYQI